MKKRVIISLVVILVLVMVGPVLAQDDDKELDCPAFANSSTENRVTYYVGEGMAYADSGQVSRAIYSYTCIVELIDPTYVPGYMARAMLYTQRHDYELAVEDFNRVIDLQPDFLAAYNNRGIVYAAQQEYELALADFDHVLGADSGYVIAYNNRAVIYAILGDYDQAIADLEQAISVSGIDAIYAEITDPDRPAGTEDPEYNPNHAQPYALLGIIYSAQALDNYEAYLRLKGSQSDARIQSAAGSLESRFTFELRLDDGTWLFTAAFSPIAG
ncbi:MAG: tetratricopeptide repeat protein [Anaerolineae bacterium]|nr:tetratricopeptide repeat protein [Anaerolineae bacterium]